MQNSLRMLESRGRYYSAPTAASVSNKNHDTTIGPIIAAPHEVDVCTQYLLLSLFFI